MARVINSAVQTSGAVVLPLLGLALPITVQALPGAGGTLAVEYSCTDTAVSDPATANWTAWPAGTVSAATADALNAPAVALRVTAATAPGSIEVVTS